MEPWIDGESINKQVAEESICNECGSACRYESERGIDPETGDRYYNAFVVCTQCEHREEF